MKWKLFVAVVGLLLLGLILVGCGATPEPCPECPECPEAECPECPAAECPDCPECPEAECPECPAAECPEAAMGCPFEADWAGSGHADAEAEAFVHWDEDGAVSTSCAKCHSEGGYLDFLGVDGSAAGVVDAEAAIGTSVTCAVCHNEATLVKTSVVMPSGIELTGLGDEARCMECHQGRQSAVSVGAMIEEAAVEEDEASEDLGFANIHYYAAAATKYGTLAKGGYEYEGKTYDANFAHVDEFDTCIECHNPHTLELEVEGCAACHSEGDPKDIRMAGSLVDFDGDGDMEEGVYYEIEGLQAMLYEALQAYGSEVTGGGLVYDAGAYPYFFDEAGERLATWTPRLVKAAYNYQVSLKDPGGYAHGGKYIIQLLYDSIESLNEALASPIDLSGASRIDHGHFAGSEEAFRHWDEDGAVSASCARCHSADGLPFLQTHGVEIEQELSNGFECATCHASLADYSIYEVTDVEFPSGATVDSGSPETNLCLNCHQGRSSSASVDRSVGDKDADTVSEDLGFINIHYFAAGATLFGNETMGAYQYAGKEYVGRNAHVEAYANCTDCHSTHMLEVKSEECSACHGDFAELTDIRLGGDDYDGDGDTAEGVAGEIETMAEALYAAMVTYSADTVGTAIVYDSHSYPYFFTDLNGDGEATPDEANYGNRYTTWTPRLLKAAYNYQYAQKDPGAFAHNPKYVIQVLYDGIEDMGGDVSGMTRP